jgi:hypothetical protein
MGNLYRAICVTPPEAPKRAKGSMNPARTAIAFYALFGAFMNSERIFDNPNHQIEAASARTDGEWWGRTCEA